MAVGELHWMPREQIHTELSLANITHPLGSNRGKPQNSCLDKESQQRGCIISTQQRVGKLSPEDGKGELRLGW